MEGRLTVAVEASPRRTHVLPALVALQTGGGAVGAGEREARELVIEGHLRPAIGGVAGAAVLPELAAVPVVPPVAGHTLCRRFDELAIDVTGVACGVEVGTGEREDGLGVIKGELEPCRRLVACAAVLNELTAVHIGFAVAGPAQARQPHPLAVDVTGLAVRLQVAADKSVAGQLMVEKRIGP